MKERFFILFFYMFFVFLLLLDGSGIFFFSRSFAMTYTRTKKKLTVPKNIYMMQLTRFPFLTFFIHNKL